MGDDQNRVRLEELLGSTYDSIADGGETGRADFVFHLLDGADDIQRFAKLLADPSALSKQEAHDVTIAFITHVSGHLATAARLAGLFTDPFAVKSN